MADGTAKDLVRVRNTGRGDALTPVQFGALAEMPGEVEWLANITNPKTRRAYKIDVEEFIAFAGLRDPAADVTELSRLLSELFLYPAIFVWGEEQRINLEMLEDPLSANLHIVIVINSRQPDGSRSACCDLSTRLKEFPNARGLVALHVDNRIHDLMGSKVSRRGAPQKKRRMASRPSYLPKVPPSQIASSVNKLAIPSAL